MSVQLKQKPNGIYYIDTHLPDGQGGLKRARISFDTRDKADAEAQRRDWLAGLHPKHPAMGGVVAPKGRVAPPNPSTRTKVDQGPTVHLWLTKCLSAPEVWGKKKATRTHQSNVRILCSMLPADLLMAELTSQHVKDLERSMRDDHGYAEASIRKLLGSLSAACRFAEDEGVITVRPKFPSITVDNVQDRVVTWDEEAVMWECIDARIEAEPLRQWRAFKRLIRVLLDTGCRLSEALHSGPSSIKRKPGKDRQGRRVEGVWLHLPRQITKSGKARDIPLTSRLRELLPELTANAAGGRWFPWPIGSSGPLYLLQCIREDMKLRGFDFDNVKLHTFRHTCATRLAEGGMDLLALRDWLGHSDIKITAGRYLHLMNAHIYPGVLILEEYAGTYGADGGNDDEDGSEFSMDESRPSGRNCDTPVTAHYH